MKQLKHTSEKIENLREQMIGFVKDALTALKCKKKYIFVTRCVKIAIKTYFFYVWQPDKVSSRTKQTVFQLNPVPKSV